MLVNRVLRSTRTLLVNANVNAIARLSLAASKRHYSKKHNPPPLCSNSGAQTCGNKEEDKCADPDAKKKDPTEGFEFHHLLTINTAICCEDPCPDVLPRFDDCLYVESDKAKRPYPRTWVECPDKQIKPKKICCFHKGIHPKIPRRKHKPSTACPPPELCGSQGNECPKVVMPGCPPANMSPTCKRVRHKTACVKVKTPYPSFSECDHPRIKRKRKTECECLVLPPSCIIARILKQLEDSGKKGNFSKCP